jgi:hypothetical protein
MKLRLQVTLPSGLSFPFEHGGPAVRIGRNPDDELALAGQSPEMVGWDHALMELTSDGALVSDIGSHSGTYLNDRKVDERTGVKPGDQILLGPNGPTLQVVEVECTPVAVQPPAGAATPGGGGADWWQGFPAAVGGATAPQTVDPPPAPITEPPSPLPPMPSPLVSPTPSQAVAKESDWWQAPAQPTSVLPAPPVPTAGPSAPSLQTHPLAAAPTPAPERRWPGAPSPQIAPAAPGASLKYLALVLGLLAGMAAVAGAIAVGWMMVRKPVASEIAKVPEPTQPVVTPPPVTTHRAPPPTTQKKPPKKPPVKHRPQKIGTPPELQVRDVGQYVAQEKAPSVLVHRQRDSDPWGRLNNGSKVQTGYHLVSLPGYQSKIILDSGVQMTLWGNVPAFSDFPPVLESTVMLHAPATGVDLEFTLDHGRVLLANGKASGPAHIRLRFLTQTWNVTLPEPGSEVAVEFWGLEQPGDPLDQKAAGTPLLVLDLYTVRSKATLEVGGQKYNVPPSAQVNWTNLSGKVEGPQTLAQLPPWWVTKPDLKQPQVADMAVALLDYRDLLKQKAAVNDTVLTQVRESNDSANRQLGVLSLGALDAALPLVDSLEDRLHADVRSAASYALRYWMGRNEDHRQELLRTLHEKKGYSPEKATLIVALLRGCSDQAAKRPQTYAGLIALLNHDNLAVRELAFQQLAMLAPDIARSIKYDPVADAEKRAVAVAEWKKRIPDGKVPPRR